MNGEFQRLMFELQWELSPSNVDPPAEKRTYALGIIDSHGAIHSVVVGNPAQVHTDFWPLAYRKWRYNFLSRQLMILEDREHEPEYQLTEEEREHIYRHLERKGLRTT